MGGLVVVGSVKRQSDGLTVHFSITDTAKSMPVVYKGFLPDLFKEGKGVVVHGKLEAGNVFRADEVLAKHDENYIAPEAAYAMKQAAKGQSAVNAASSISAPTAK
jgi:cytochrome c-type biogenesis protein CcmE